MRRSLGATACKKAGREGGWLDHRQAQSTQSSGGTSRRKDTLEETAKTSA